MLPLEILVAERFMRFFLGGEGGIVRNLQKYVCMCVGNDTKVEVLYPVIKAVTARH